MKNQKKILKLYSTKERMNHEFKIHSGKLEGLATIHKSNKIIYIGNEKIEFGHENQLYKYELQNFNRVQIEDKVKIETLHFINTRIVQ